MPVDWRQHPVVGGAHMVLETEGFDETADALLDLMGKAEALAEAVRILLASDTGAELRGDPGPTIEALAAWDRLERGEA